MKKNFCDQCGVELNGNLFLDDIDLYSKTPAWIFGNIRLSVRAYQGWRDEWKYGEFCKACVLKAIKETIVKVLEPTPTGSRGSKGG